MELRDYQRDIYSKAQQAILQGHKGILCVLPCRSGKSYIMAEMIRNLKGYGLVLVHRNELMQQHIELLNKLNIRNVRVASVFTEVNHLGEYDAPSVIFIDECHLSEASSYKKVCKYYNTYVIGFSATPVRLSGERLTLYDSIVTGITANELIQRGAISDYDYYAPDVGFDAYDVRTIAGDYSKSELQDLMCKSQLYGDVIKYYNELASGKQAIAYCVSIKHSQMVRDLFLEAGISAVHIDSHLPKKERLQLMDDFKTGKYTILCNVGLISEGITIPNCDVCLLLRPTQSMALYIQQSMRCLTPNGNKSVIIDYVGNFQRHGLPTEDREWTLDGAIRKPHINEDGSYVVRQCPDCFRIFKTASECPYCGHKYEVKGRELEQMESVRLRKISEEELIKLEAEKKKMRMEVGMARSKADLVAIARERGYKIGWVFQMMKLKGIKK